MGRHGMRRGIKEGLGVTVQLPRWSSARCEENMEEMKDWRLERKGGKDRWQKPSVTSQRNLHVLARKMPRFQGLAGIKLNGQSVNPRDSPVSTSPELGLLSQTTMPGSFIHACWQSNLGSPACKICVLLTTEPSPHSFALSFSQVYNQQNTPLLGNLSAFSFPGKKKKGGVSWSSSVSLRCKGNWF